MFFLEYINIDRWKAMEMNIANISTSRTTGTILYKDNETNIATSKATSYE